MCQGLLAHPCSVTPIAFTENLSSFDHKINISGLELDADNYSTPLTRLLTCTLSIPTWLVSVCALPHFRRSMFNTVIEFLTIPDSASYYACVSAFSPPEDRNTAYVHIKKEIQALGAAIRTLKVRHNSLSTTSRLPPELLSRIFEFLARGENNKAKQKPDWIGISYVCSQ